MYAPRVERENEVELLTRLFEVESTMDEVRFDPEATERLSELAAERDRLRAGLEALVPEGEELGYQGDGRPFTKADHDGRFIPQIGESAGGGLG